MEYAGRETSSHGDLLRYQSHVMADQVQVGGTQRIGPDQLFPPSHHLFGHHCLVQLPAGRSCRLPESRWRWQFAF